MNSPAITAFRSTPEKLAAVYQALSDPMVQEALQLIHLANIPVDPLLLKSPAGLHNDSVVSRKYHFMLGVHEAITTLKNMALPIPVREPEPDGEEEYFMP